jgi:hypothetical protein
MALPPGNRVYRYNAELLVYRNEVVGRWVVRDRVRQGCWPRTTQFLGCPNVALKVAHFDLLYNQL